MSIADIEIEHEKSNTSCAEDPNQPKQTELTNEQAKEAN
jgi:hypothetical protein